MSDPNKTWRPSGAPDVKTDFYKARRPEFQPDIGRGPVSQKQVDDLKTQRSTVLPPALHLDPPGTKAPAPNREEQVRFMENRLSQTKGIAKSRFQDVSRGRER